MATISWHGKGRASGSDQGLALVRSTPVRLVGLTTAGTLAFFAVQLAYATPPWFLIAFVAVLLGASSGRIFDMWTCWVAVVVAHTVAELGGYAPSDEPLPLFHQFQAAVVASVGFAVGTSIGIRSDRIAANLGSWRVLRPRSRQFIAGVVLAVALAAPVYGVAVGAIAKDTWSSNRSTDCRTPQAQYGWPYEAINYDQSTDGKLTAHLGPNKNGDVAWQCDVTPAAAGTAVVTSDGVGIAGWYIAAASAVGSDGPTIVVVPGGGSNKSDTLRYAVPLHHDFNVVILDDRGMGQSGGDFAMGALEPLDVSAIVEWLVETKHPSWIGAVGNSMGAATALAEAVNDERVRALVLDSMDATTTGEAGSILEREWGLPAFPATLGIAVIGSLQVGADVTAVDPVKTIGKLGSRPVLLIHGTADTTDVPALSAEQNFHAAAAAGVPVEMHYCMGGHHGQLIDECGPDWSMWTNTFLDTASAQPRAYAHDES